MQDVLELPKVTEGQVENAIHNTLGTIDRKPTPGYLVVGFTSRVWSQPEVSLLAGNYCGNGRVFSNGYYRPDQMVSVQLSPNHERFVDVSFKIFEKPFCQTSGEWVHEHLKRTAEHMRVPYESLIANAARNEINWRFVGCKDGQVIDYARDNGYPWNPRLWCFVSEVIGGADRHFASMPDWARELTLATLRKHRSEGITVLER